MDEGLWRGLQTEASIRQEALRQLAGIKPRYRVGQRVSFRSFLSTDEHPDSPGVIVEVTRKTLDAPLYYVRPEDGRESDVDVSEGHIIGVLPSSTSPGEVEAWLAE